MAFLRPGRCGSRPQSGCLQHRTQAQRRPTGQDAGGTPALPGDAVPGESMGTLLTYWKNFVPASEPWLAKNEQPTFRQARLNALGLQHTLSHYAVSSPSSHIQGISESPRPVFPVIQQRPLFSLLFLAEPRAVRSWCMASGWMDEHVGRAGLFGTHGARGLRRPVLLSVVE